MFQEALDRFAQFFIEPLFTESATERELKVRVPLCVAWAVVTPNA